MLRSLVQGLGGLSVHKTKLPMTLAAAGTSIKGDIIANTPLSTPHSLQHVRTTFKLRRIRRVELVKTHQPPEARRFKPRHFLYELVDFENNKSPEPIKVLLMTSVEGVGSRGDVVEVKPHMARNKLLLPGLAVYASPENLEKYKSLREEASHEDQPSSPFVKFTMKDLSLRVISVTMSLHTPWTLEPWHVRVAFRKCGIIVPEDAITLPSQEISGPDLSMQDKEFIVRVQINKKEETPVRCRIHHFSNDPLKRLPFAPFHWLYPGTPLFAEDAPLLEELTKNNKNTRYPEEEDL